MPPGMRILLSFIQDNRLRLVDWFNQFDKDHSGGISREEFKTGLKETGLVMTQVSTVTNKSFCPHYYFVCNIKSCFIVVMFFSFLIFIYLQRQLDRLIDFIDINDDGEIEYR